MSPDEIRRILEFYQDIGIRSIYRRGSQLTAPAPEPEPEPVFSFDQLPPLPPKTPRVAPPAPRQAVERPSPALTTPPPAPAAPTAPMELIPLAPDNDSLAAIRTDIGDCRRCRLCEGRNKIVFGSGNESSPLVFVGEGPGADEDASGLPFVGRAGQLLTQMIEGTAAKEGIAIKRPDVYICNVVKCRPPENRAPQPDEMEICGQFLFRQLSVIRPKAICALGSTAAKAVLGTKDGVTKLRGNWHKWRDIPVMVTYHPSYLLRPYNQNAKREAWEDLKKVLHFVYD